MVDRRSGLFGFVAVGAVRSVAGRLARRGSGVPSRAAMLAGSIAVVAVLGGAAAAGTKVPRWFGASYDDRLPAYSQFDNAFGKLGVLNESGDVPTKGHPFLAPLGANGRACVTCHQPGNAMSISTDSLRAHWQQAGFRDPVFAAIDGSNCPNLPQDKRASHSLLLDHALFRVPRPWPPRDLSGKAIEPEFSIEVVRDPTGCNLDRKYGIKSADPTISVYRRPRVVANMRFVTSDDTNPRAVIGNKTGLPRAQDPETGKFIYLPLLADGAQPSTRRQSNAAATGHQGFVGKLSADQLKQLDDFMMQIYVAQDYSNGAGRIGGPGGPQGLGTAGFKDTPGPRSAMREDRQVFKTMEEWRHKTPKTPAEEFQASVVRGYDVFFRRPFFIKDVANFTDIGMGNPYKRTCAICHNVQLSGIDNAPGFMDIGVENQPWADPAPHLPLFKLTCKPTAKPHPYLGRVIYTSDPGRALISGRCMDIGNINLSQLRGLAARAPYFTNGSAKDLPTLVDFYNRRFAMKLSPREKTDLVNFLSVL